MSSYADTIKAAKEAADQALAAKNTRETQKRSEEAQAIAEAVKFLEDTVVPHLEEAHRELLSSGFKSEVDLIAASGRCGIKLEGARASLQLSARQEIGRLLGKPIPKIEYVRWEADALGSIDLKAEEVRALISSYLRYSIAEVTR